MERIPENCVAGMSPEELGRLDATIKELGDTETARWLKEYRKIMVDMEYGNTYHSYKFNCGIDAMIPRMTCVVPHGKTGIRYSHKDSFLNDQYHVFEYRGSRYPHADIYVRHHANGMNEVTNIYPVIEGSLSKPIYNGILDRFIDFIKSAIEEYT